MQGNDLLTESHSDTGSALLAGSGLIHHIKSLRDPRDLFLRIPLPLSTTLISYPCVRLLPFIRINPPSSTAFTALSNRLYNSDRSRSLSPQITPLSRSIFPGSFYVQRGSASYPEYFPPVLSSGSFLNSNSCLSIPTSSSNL